MNFIILKKLRLILIPLAIIFMGCSDQHNISPQRFRVGSQENPLGSIIISWHSSSDEDIIKWGYTNTFECGEFVSNERSNDIHYSTIQSPVPSSLLYYSILNGEKNQWSDAYTIQTGSGSIDSFSFCFGGDSQENYDTWENMASRIEKSDFFLFLGDNVQNGNSNEQWDEWFDEGAEFLSQQLVYYTQGNHEGGEKFKTLFDFPDNGEELYYSFEYKNALFICLDSEEPDDDEQLVFLEEQLSLHSNKTWKFVFFHRPFFTEGEHSVEMQPYLETWWQAFDEYGVDVVMNGHIHNYSRTKPINMNITNNEGFHITEEYGSSPEQGRMQIISGGLGGTLSLEPPGTDWFVESLTPVHHYCKIEIKNNYLIFTAKDINGNAFDKVEIIKDSHF